jgi:PleD family two-component response regulator
VEWLRELGKEERTAKTRYGGEVLLIFLLEKNNQHYCLVAAENTTPMVSPLSLDES